MTILGRMPGTRQVELIPFYTVFTISDNDEAIRTMVMNVILFLPFGLTLPCVLGKIKNNRRRWLISILIGFLISIGVESLQYLFAIGRAETDDVICNTCGCALGVLADVIADLVKRRKNRKSLSRVGYKWHNIRNFILFAFYPMTTWVTCIVLTIIINCILIVVMQDISKTSVLYDVVYALITGATASLLVSVVIEFMNNYKNNRLGWQELQDYYNAVWQYEITRQIDLQQDPFQRARRKAIDEYKLSGGEYLEDEFECPKDVVSSTWMQLPEIIPIMKETLETKKEFLSDDEIDSLRNILSEYRNIRYTVKRRLDYFFGYNASNHSDEEYLRELYPKNIVEDMPDWIKRHLANNESERAIEKITDEIMADEFLMQYCMEGYDISEECLERNASLETDELDDNMVNDGVNNQNQEEMDEEDMDEETFRENWQKEMDELEKREIPFYSKLISQSCFNISKVIDDLEKYILRKPYVGSLLKASKNLSKEPLDDIISKMEYEEMKKEISGGESK